MAKKQFKAESKKLMDMMINSIYTHKDIFLRELISNASDALDKRYYHALSKGESGTARDDYRISLAIDKESRTLTVSDNGCGFDVSGVGSSGDGHFGLDGIRQRVMRLNGAFTITSQPGSGTSAVIRIPHPFKS